MGVWPTTSPSAAGASDPSGSVRLARLCPRGMLSWRGGSLMASSTVAPAAVEYPSSDGKPVAESDFQLTPIAYARDALRDYYRSRCEWRRVRGGQPVHLLRGGQPQGGGGAGRVRGARRRRPRPPRLSAVAGAEGARLRAGGDVATHVAGGPGAEAEAVPRARGRGVLAVRSDRGTICSRGCRGCGWWPAGTGG